MPSVDLKPALPSSTVEIIKALGLTPHVEGGHFRETWRTTYPDDKNGERGNASGIYYLLAKGERSHWHRVHDADELWLWHAGAPLNLFHAESDDGQTRRKVLGIDVVNGESPQVLIPKGHWQSAEPMGDWSLVSCIVAPGFLYGSFEMAPPGWFPGSRLLEGQANTAVQVNGPLVEQEQVPVKVVKAVLKDVAEVIDIE